MSMGPDRWIVRYTERPPSGDEVSETLPDQEAARRRVDELRGSDHVIASTIGAWHHLDAIGRGSGPIRRR